MGTSKVGVGISGEVGLVCFCVMVWFGGDFMGLTASNV